MPRLPLRFPSYVLPPVTLSSSSTRLEGWENFNAIYGRNLQEIELPNPYVRVIPVAQTISSLGTDVVWSQESTVWPRQSMDPVLATTNFLEIPFDGLWTVDGSVAWNDSTVGHRVAFLRKVSGRGSTGDFAQDERIAAPAVTRQSLSATVPLYKGDRIALALLSEGAEPIFGGDAGSWLAISGIGIRGTT